MSRMIPRETIDCLRHQVDISLDNYGIDCTLYIPTVDSSNTAEKLDVFATPNDYKPYVEYSAKVFIEWNPSTYRLRKLGVFVEDSIPILAWFGNKAVNQDKEKVDIDIILRSYFEIPLEFIPENRQASQQFEIVNNIVKGMHDAVIRKGYVIVPRRMQQ